MKRSKLLNIICSITVSVLFILVLLLGLILTGVISVNTNRIVIKSESAQAVYSGVPLTCEEWQIISGGLEDGHTVDVSFSGVQTYAGESRNMFYVTIRDSFGADVTSTYDLVLEYGTLKVMPKPIKIISGSAQKMYDGEPLTCPDWSYYPLNAIPGNGSITVDVVGSITEVGVTANSIGWVAIYNDTGKDITSNYEITFEYGFLTVLGEGMLGGLGGLAGMINGDGMLDLSGMICGNELSNDGEDVVCYQVYNQVDDTIYLKLKSFGDYTGRSWGDAIEYDNLIGLEFSADYLTGTAIDKTFSSVTIRSLNGQYALPYYMRRTYTSEYDVQSSDVMYKGNTDEDYTVYYAQFDPAAKYKADNTLVDYEREYRNFVYGQYLYTDADTAKFMQSIISEQGFSGQKIDTVYAVAKYIQNSATYNLKYDRELDNQENIAIAFLRDYKEGICQHYATAATLLYRTMGIPARYTVGFMGETVSGEWVDITAKSAHAWVEVYLDGIGWIMVEVTGGNGGGGGGGGNGGGGNDQQQKITIKPMNADKQYDGTPLLPTGEISGFDSYYAKGYSIDVTVIGSQLDYGKGQSKITKYVIYDPDGKDVTSQFDVTLRAGILHVYAEVLLFTSNGATKTYDGTALSTDINTCNIVGGNFVFGGEELELTPSASIIDVGTKVADFKVKITLDGQDITDYYKIVKNCGLLTVGHRQITVKADDAQKVYDGTPLVSESYSITDGEIVKGQFISSCTIKVEQERIGVGRSQCIPSDVVILDEQGNDVTKNYTIKYEEGTLRVLPE